MQAFKKAAREGDSSRLDALCEAWSVPAAEDREAEPEVTATAASPAISERVEDAAVSQSRAETRR
jgi:hypothetical protein